MLRRRQPSLLERTDSFRLLPHECYDVLYRFVECRDSTHRFDVQLSMLDHVYEVLAMSVANLLSSPSIDGADSRRGEEQPSSDGDPHHGGTTVIPEPYLEFLLADPDELPEDELREKDASVRTVDVTKVFFDLSSYLRTSLMLSQLGMDDELEDELLMSPVPSAVSSTLPFGDGQEDEEKSSGFLGRLFGRFRKKGKAQREEEERQERQKEERKRKREERQLEKEHKLQETAYFVDRMKLLLGCIKACLVVEIGFKKISNSLELIKELCQIVLWPADSGGIANKEVRMEAILILVLILRGRRSRDSDLTQLSIGTENILAGLGTGRAKVEQLFGVSYSQIGSPDYCADYVNKAMLLLNAVLAALQKFRLKRVRDVKSLLGEQGGGDVEASLIDKIDERIDRLIDREKACQVVKTHVGNHLLQKVREKERRGEEGEEGEQEQEQQEENRHNLSSSLRFLEDQSKLVVQLQIFQDLTQDVQSEKIDVPVEVFRKFIAEERDVIQKSLRIIAIRTRAESPPSSPPEADEEEEEREGENENEAEKDEIPEVSAAVASLRVYHGQESKGRQIALEVLSQLPPLQQASNATRKKPLPEDEENEGEGEGESTDVDVESPHPIPNIIPPDTDPMILESLPSDSDVFRHSLFGRDSTLLSRAEETLDRIDRFPVLMGRIFGKSVVRHPESVASLASKVQDWMEERGPDDASDRNRMKKCEIWVGGSRGVDPSVLVGWIDSYDREQLQVDFIRVLLDNFPSGEEVYSDTEADERASSFIEGLNAKVSCLQQRLKCWEFLEAVEQKVAFVVQQLDKMNGALGQILLSKSLSELLGLILATWNLLGETRSSVGFDLLESMPILLETREMGGVDTSILDHLVRLLFRNKVPCVEVVPSLCDCLNAIAGVSVDRVQETLRVFDSEVFAVGDHLRLLQERGLLENPLVSDLKQKFPEVRALQKRLHEDFDILVGLTEQACSFFFVGEENMRSGAFTASLLAFCKSVQKSVTPFQIEKRKHCVHRSALSTVHLEFEKMMAEGKLLELEGED